MAKDKHSLAQSDNTRGIIITKYGFVPESIMVHDKSDKSIDLMVEGSRSYEAKAFKDETGEMGESLEKRFTMSNRGVRGEGAGLSRFPQNIGRYLVKMYSEPGQTVLDPFAGHNSRMELVWKCERNYIGFDVSHEFMQANFKIKEMLLAKTNSGLPGLEVGATITIHETDSHNISKFVGPSSVDMVISSPPFWDIEWYGDEYAQLGKCETYSQFLDNLQEILKQCSDAMKPGCYMCLEVQDFRKEGRYYPLHSDTIRIFREIDIRLHDIIIVDFGTCIGSCFASQLEEQKRSAKRHSYVVIGKKASLL